MAVSVEHGVDICARAAPLWPAVRAAAGDSQVERYWAGVTAGRQAGLGALVRHLSEVGGLRDDLELERATDLLFVLHSHDTFEGLIQSARWSAPKYKSWLYRTLAQQLLRPGRSPRTATAGLSWHSEFTTRTVR